MTDKITITRKDGAYIVTIDGGSIECGTAAEVMSRIGHEMGMPFNKAQRQLFERMEAAEHHVDYLHQVNEEGVKINAILRDENDKLKQAIVAWFLRAFKEGGVRDALS